MISAATPLAADRVGSGEPLLLLHGIGTTRADFDATLPRLAEHYDVVAMDLPGHGESPALERRHTVAALADAVAADLDTRGLDRVHVLGNSLGGRIALELARRGRARSVVAVVPSGMGSPPERLYQASALVAARLAFTTIRPLLPVLARRRAARAALLAALRARPWATTEEEALALRGGFADARRFWDTLWWTVLVDLPTGMSDVACPVTLVQGGLDLLAPGQAARYLATLQGARFEPLLFAGHASQGDSPAQIVRIVRATTAQAPPEKRGE
jgi:pimeloyl-ACP methyl ester carboxylesterase